MYNCPSLSSNGIVFHPLLLVHSIIFKLILLRVSNFYYYLIIIIVVFIIRYGHIAHISTWGKWQFSCVATFSPSTTLATFVPFTLTRPLIYIYIYISIDVCLLLVLNRIVIVGFRTISPSPQHNLFHSLEKYIYCCVIPNLLLI